MASARDSSPNRDVSAAMGGGEEQAFIEVFDTACVLIRNALTLEEQERLCAYIEEKDKTPAGKPRAMVPAPQTLILGEDGHPQVRYVRGEDPTVVSALVEKASGILKQQLVDPASCPLISNGKFKICDYRSLAMATIRYEAPDGRFPAHVDHCSDSFVVLASLGRTANFMVKGLSMDARKDFKFCSGDVLVFDASTTAALLHSCVSIDESASPAGGLLASKFPVLQKHRYGVQCRVFF
mmetsp:Transcript_6255/g.18500  ORF Transcript_6255/g.18500 Transcript_6255/m.18500 type:complete len:238 (-) Transcript_6255:76-789(-)